MRIKEHVILSRYTTIGIGGRSRYFIEVENKDELKKAFEFIKSKNLEYFVLGGGSNLLIEDRELNIAIIKPRFSDIKVQGTTVVVGASFKLPILIKTLLEEELSGLEELAEIPGEIGGAVYMNAGSYGREIGEVVEKIEIFNGDQFITIKGDEIGFSYRKTRIKRDWIITRVWLKLSKGTRYRMSSLINTVKIRRRKSQPVGQKTFGSVFKNPEGYSAGYLIDMCGLKGHRKNDAKISEKHANFIINTGTASFSDVLTLMETAQKEVRNRFGIELEPEVIILREG